jgi:hypothetical protein
MYEGMLLNPRHKFEMFHGLHYVGLKLVEYLSPSIAANRGAKPIERP